MENKFIDKPTLDFISIDEVIQTISIHASATKNTFNTSKTLNSAVGHEMKNHYNKQNNFD